MKRYLFAALLLVLYSCSTLKVSVSTANPDSLKSIADKIDPFEKLAFQYKKALQPLTAAKILTDKEEIVSQFEQMLKLDGKDSNDNAVTSAAFNHIYTDVVNDILSDYNQSNILMVEKKYKEAVDLYLVLPQKLQTLIDNLRIEAVLKPEQKEPLIKEISGKLSVANAVFYGGRANLLGDKMVSYITLTENDTIWKSTYNKTVSRTSFGNADIAVVLNEMPDSYNNNYSIKGVRVDAAKLIQSTFDVMTQVVNVAASMYGIMPANTGDANSFYPEQFSDIQTLPVKTAELQNRKDLLRESQKQLLLKILGENLQPKKTEELKASVTQIKTFWDTYKANLTP